MEPIQLTATAKTPEVLFDATKGLISFKGRSIPEHTVEFYKPLHQWIDEYGQNPQAFTTIEIFVEYYNTSSSKSILDLFKRLENVHKMGHDMVVQWYYEEDDEALLESGEEYESMVDIPFELISVPVDDDEDDE
ncbi:MAG: DUF1987 domain-containing protein [Flavobacteriales bacterium]|nr:DUF1987 domain-containing protein [Flavobacteriales bacterium]